MSFHNRSIIKGEGDLKRYSSETNTLTKANASMTYYTKKPN